MYTKTDLKAFLGFVMLGSILVLTLTACSISPQTQEAMKVVDYQTCVQHTGSYVECKQLEVVK